ncbi:uracil-DNA glycosylase [Nadsonia fulvescens var. elongata DSM 6958]|uniref:Uracil-DNA glycosylase n=1 Tax=Nadsonia fulvescens var. elongata DSM 6958 TaxID=857566 RepID=A0A1E3PHC8_9ASCO|nr:uracil-DNA glycosylase [Nadsonia fulvescens var. elongata DSM 6958]
MSVPGAAKRKLKDSKSVQNNTLSSYFKKVESPNAKKPKVEDTVTERAVPIIKSGLPFFKLDKTRPSSNESKILSVFDKKKWVDSLSIEQQDLLELEINTLEESWLTHLHKELVKPYFLELKRFLKAEKDRKQIVFPSDRDIYSWTQLTKFEDVKVVILGQDPYHNYNQAHGLAFSVKPPTVPPPSLKNMYKTIKIDYPEFEIPKTNGLLTKWSEQGVLLLNACLTVRAHQANSHAKKGWETFTEKVVEIILKREINPVCFMAWGSSAAQRVDQIKTNKERHLILKAVHPSPLSASRGYFQCAHYKKANEWILKTYGPKDIIDWALEPGNIITEIMDIKNGQGEKV